MLHENMILLVVNVSDKLNLNLNVGFCFSGSCIRLTKFSYLHQVFAMIFCGAR